MKSPDSSKFVLNPSSSCKSSAEREALMQAPSFGNVFTDHMVTIDWRDAAWTAGELKAFGNLSLSPAASALHYGQAVFEGFKVYRHEDGTIQAFRPHKNAERFVSSARRLAMPELPVDLFMEASDLLVRQDRAWVPTTPGSSLYVRPVMFASEPTLGVRPARQYIAAFIACVVEGYFSGGKAPIRVWLSTEHVRAAPGGTGAVKCAGNYAASLEAQALAKQQGDCEQVLYLDAIERRYIEELGGMNFFMVLKRGSTRVLVTPELSSGTLLAGVTRDSVLQLAPDFGLEIEERRIDIEELRTAASSGTLEEAFACGTAAVITPIAALKSEREEIAIGAEKTGPVAQRLLDELVGIQEGRRPDRHGWMHKICVSAR